MPRKLDDLSLNFFLHLGYFPGYEATVTLDYSRIDRNGYKDHSRDDLLEAGYQALMQSVTNDFESNARHILPLSGGMDSRTILAALLEMTDAGNIQTYTFGTPGTCDYDLGNKVAELAGTNHTKMPLTDLEWHMDDMLELARRFDCQTFLFHHAPLAELRRFENGVTWSGYIGDAVTGGHLKDTPAASLDEAKSRYLEKRAEIRSLNLLTRPAKDFAHKLGGERVPDIMTHDERVLFAEVGCITAPHVLMKGFEYKTPMINSPFFDFFMSIPDTHRKGQSLFLEMIIRKWPKLFGLPSKTYFGLTPGHGSLPVFLRRARNKLWNIGRQKLRMFDWPPLPMTNFFDFDLEVRRNKSLRDLVRQNLADLDRRQATPWIQAEDIFNRHMARKGHFGDALKCLTSLEINLKAMEGQQ